MKLDLKKKKVLITRAEHQSEAFKKLVERANGTAVLFPTIEIKGIEDLTEIKKALDALDQIDWLVFTSENAVNYFFGYAHEYGIKFYFYPDLKIATVGEKTKLALEQLGYRTNFVPIEYTAKVLAENMDLDIAGKKVLIPRSSKATDEYIRVFEERGAQAIPLTVYENVIKSYDSNEAREFLSDDFDYITFTSGSTLKGFMSAIEQAQIEYPKARYLSIGPSTSKIAETVGLQIDATAKEYTIEGIMETIKNFEHV